MSPVEESVMGSAIQTEQHKKAFLDTFARCGVIVTACAASGVSRTMVYEWQKRDDAFAAAFQVAQAESVEVLETEVFRRAVTGVERPIVREGKIVGTVRDYSDNLLMFLLKGRRPETYRDNAKITHNGAVDLNPLGKLLQDHDTRLD
jgi:hypothetical protein